MKKLVTLLLFCFGCGLSLRAQVAISRDGSQPDSSAMLDIKSTAKGVLIPRMSTAQRQAIISPAVGLIVFDSDVKAFDFYNGTGWTPIATGAGSNPWALIGVGSNPWNPGAATIYDDSAWIGIGTNSPQSRVDVRTDDFNFGLTHSNGVVRVGTFIGEGAGWVATATPHPLYFGTAELYNNIDPQMVLTTGGTVGINNKTPNETYKLDVTGSINSTGNVGAVVLNARDSVKAPIIHGTELNAAGSLNFQQPIGKWTIEEISSGDLHFIFTNSAGSNVVFVFTPDGAIKGPKIGPNLQAANLTIRDQQQLIGQQSAQIQSLTDRLAALEKKVSTLK